MAEELSKEDLRERLAELESALERYSLQEQQSRKRLEYLEKLNLIEQALRSTEDLEIALWEGMGRLLDIFGCDRAWLLYPCDPEAPSWRVPVERTTPEYPGAGAVETPMTPDVAEILRTALKNSGPVVYGPGGVPLGENTKGWRVQSQMSMAIRPGGGPPWQLGVHQCSYPRAWSPAERDLFREIGYRIATAVGAMTTVARLRESEAEEKRVREELERRVLGRTDELARANRLLEDKIEEVRKSDRSLAESRAQLMAAIDSLPFDFFALDREGRYTLQNRFCREGWGDVIGKTPAEVATSPAMARLWEENNLRALAGERVEGEVDYLQGNRHRRIYNVISPIRRDGKVSGILGINIDVTEGTANERLLALQHRLARKLSEAVSLHEGLDACLEAVFSASGMECGGVYFFDRREGTVTLAASRNLSQRFVEQVSSYRIGVNVAPPVLEGRPVFTTVERMPEIVRGPMEEEGLKAIAVLPVVHGGEVIGCINATSARALEVSAEAREALMAIASQVGGAVIRLRAEEALRDSEEKFRLVAENSPDGIIIGDDRGGFVDANPSACRIFGYTKEEFAGLRRRELHPSGDPEIDRIAKSRESKGRFRGMVRLRRKDGSVFPAELSLTSFLDSSRRMRVLGIVTDVSDREAAFRVLDIQKDLAASLLVAAGLEEGLSSCLEAACLVTGLEAGGAYELDVEKGILDLVVSRNLSDDFVERVSRFPLDSHQGRIVLKGAPLFTHASERKDLVGANLEAEGLKTLAIVPIHHEGSVIGCLNVSSKHSVDVPTYARDALLGIAAQAGGALARIRSEEARRESEKKYRQLISNIPEVTWISDSEGRIVFISPNVERVCGYTAMEVLERGGESWTRDVHPDDAAAVRDSFQGMLRGEADYDIEFRLRRRDGKWIWVRDRAISSFVREERHFAFGVLGDITERKQAEEALRESEARYRLLAENVGEAILLADAGGLILKANDMACTMFGHPAARIVGLRREDFLVEPEALKETVRERKATGRFSGEMLFRRRDGSVFPGHVTVQSFRRGDQTLLAVLIRDLSESKTAEKALVESREKYRRLVDALPVGVEELDLEGRIEFANATLHEMGGYGPGELQGRPVADFIPAGKEREEFEAMFSKIIEEKPEPSSLVMRNRRKDGALVDVQVDWDYRHGPGGEVNGFTAIISDVTERRRAVEALRESEEKFRNLAEESPNMIFIARGRQLAYVNRRAEELLGRSRAELCGSGFDVASVVAPEHRRRLNAEFERHMRGRPTRPSEYALLGKGGRRIEAIVTTTPISYRGRNATLGIVTDITNRKRAEKALKESESRLRVLVEKSEEMIFSYDREGIFTFLNPAFQAITGWEPERWVGRSFEEVIHPEDREKARKRARDVTEGKTLSQGEVRVRCKSGEYVDIEYSTIPLLREGDFVGAWGIAQDVTARRKAEKDRRNLAILRERESLSRWLHDHLGADLYNIMLLVEGVQNSERISPVAAQQLEWVSSTSREALAGIRHYLDFSAQVGTSFSDLLGSMKKYGAGVVGPLGIDFSFTTEGDFERCRLSALQAFNLYLIYKEALTNIIKHSRATRATVTVTVSADGLVFTVDDNGRGYPADGTATGRFGTSNIRARAADLGAELSIATKPGSGTRLELSMGCPHHQDGDAGA